MTIRKGTYFQQVFLIRDRLTGLPVDVSGWEFESDLRDRLETEQLLSLTTNNGGWAVVDGPNGLISMQILAEQTSTLPVAKLVFDVLRTDVDPGPVWLFSGKVPVKLPVTREGDE